MQISATIISFNEAEKIGRCIASLLPVVDEIIVLDSGSTDATLSIASSLGAKCSYHAFDGHIQQKNRAAALAQYAWILSLDADECLSLELQQSILNVKKGAVSADAYRMNRLNNFAGQWIKHGGWYPDKKVRLFKKEKGSWGGLNPHDKIVLKPGSKVLQLHGDLLHYTYDQAADFALQNQKFAKAAAIAMHDQKKIAYALTPYYKAAFRWFKGYVLQFGFLDGKAGRLIAAGNARYTFDKYQMLRQLNQKKNVC
jgi:glycosyltransferase involved in cell wall biosynthesis